MPNPLPTSTGSNANEAHRQGQPQASAQRNGASTGGEQRVEDAVNSERGMASGDAEKGRQGGQRQEERDRLYEERMEDEYAKREGGA